MYIHLWHITLISESMVTGVHVHQELRLRSNGCFNKTSRRNRADVTAGMARFKALVQHKQTPKGGTVRVYASIQHGESGIFWIGWKKKVRFGLKPV